METIASQDLEEQEFPIFDDYQQISGDIIGDLKKKEKQDIENENRRKKIVEEDSKEIFQMLMKMNACSIETAQLAINTEREKKKTRKEDQIEIKNDNKDAFHEIDKEQQEQEQFDKSILRLSEEFGEDWMDELNERLTIAIDLD
ncbi:MAG: hypothetical protein EZS28_005171, partial [Streblomastix strix]